MQWIASARAVRSYLSSGNAPQVTVKSVQSVDTYVSVYLVYLRVFLSTWLYGLNRNFLVIHVIRGDREHPAGNCEICVISWCLCLHVSRVSARIEVNGQRTTVNGQRTTGNGPIRMVVCCLLSIVCWLYFINVVTRIKHYFPRDTCDTWRPVNAAQGLCFIREICWLLFKKYGVYIKILRILYVHLFFFFYICTEGKIPRF